jgi:predicted ATPase/class 3 adenylate cyclase
MQDSAERHASSREVEVALLFTDIEGSTAKWESNSAAMQAVLAQHDEIVFSAIADSGGEVMKHTGDGVIGRFTQPLAAVTAAVDAQLRFAAGDFSPVGGLRVRMGLHVGPAEDRDGDLFGRTLNCCARVMGVAHGGQVVATEQIRDHLVAAFAGEGLSEASLDFVDLGVHRLKGLGRPERLYQVCHSALPDTFPPLRSVNASLGNLPAALTTMVGRDELLDRLGELLERPGLVTLIGPGGVGKTSLALHAGYRLIDRFPDGVWFVDLASVHDAAGVAVSVARAMGVARRPDQALEDTLRDVLAVRQALLILDNAEHVREATRDVAARVALHGSSARLLATSRVALGAPAETRVRVDPLPTPDRIGVVDLADAARCPALALFVERARASRPDFGLTEDNLAHAIDICDHLDGLPLAIELAAARTEVLSVEQIAARLTRRFRLLQAGPEHDDRHRTMTATLDWSFELLSERGKQLFIRLGSLASSFDLNAASAVADADELDVLELLSELVNNSMLATDPQPDSVRYRMLETMREYAAMRLDEAPDAENVRRLHAQFFAGVAADLRHKMWSNVGLAAVDRCRLELPDLRRGFEHVLLTDPAAALEMTTDLYALWLVRDLAEEGRRWIDEAIEAVGGIEAAAPTLGLMDALDDAGTLTWLIGDLDRAESYLQAAISTAERLGRSGPAKALVRLGSMRTFAGDADEGRRLCQLALTVALDQHDAEALLVVERTLGAVLALSGEVEAGAAICKRAVERAQVCDLWLPSALTNLVLATYVTDPAFAAEAAREAIIDAGRIGSKYYVGSAWGGLGAALWELGDRAASCRAYGEAISTMLDAGAKNNVLITLDRLASAFVEAAPMVAVMLTAGAVGQHAGPPADGRWYDARQQAVRNKTEGRLDEQSFEQGWERGLELTVDAMVVLARSAVDDVFPANMATAHAPSL